MKTAYLEEWIFLVVGLYNKTPFVHHYIQKKHLVSCAVNLVSYAV